MSKQENRCLARLVIEVKEPNTSHGGSLEAYEELIKDVVINTLDSDQEYMDEHERRIKEALRNSDFWIHRFLKEGRRGCPEEAIHWSLEPGGAMTIRPEPFLHFISITILQNDEK